VGADTSRAGRVSTGSQRRGGADGATNVSWFERFFRQAAGIDADKNDLKRHNDFVDQKFRDLLLRGAANAKANNRDVS
jgi:hypothetical protein